MAHLVIQCHPDARNESCTICGKRAFAGDGPQLAVTDRNGLVCRECGKKHAPSLVALLDLAGTAERVGRIKRHTISPPMAALLDLARAAENYLEAKPRRYRQAV